MTAGIDGFGMWVTYKFMYVGLIVDQQTQLQFKEFANSLNNLKYSFLNYTAIPHLIMWDTIKT